MTDDQERTDATDADRRVVELLRATDRPRLLASEVAAALDVPRGRVRTRLQALADDGRVVRVDDGTTARWAVPDRTDEPEPGGGADTSGDDGAGDAGPDAERDGAPEGSDADGVEVPREEVADWSEGTVDVSTTAAGPTDAPRDRPTGGDSPSPRGPPDGGSEPRRPGIPTRRLILATGLVLVLVVLHRLRRG